MVAWCVKERVRVFIYFNVLEPFFIGHRDSCVRGLLARLAQVFRRLKRAFGSTLRVSCCFFFFTVTSLVLVATCIFCYSALFANGFRAKARRVTKRFVVNLYWSCIACVCLLHAARLFFIAVLAPGHFLWWALSVFEPLFEPGGYTSEPVCSKQCSSCGGGVRPWCRLQHLHQRKGGGGGC